MKRIAVAAFPFAFLVLAALALAQQAAPGLNVTVYESPT